MSKKQRKESAREKRARLVEEAMPDVKAIVRKHGLGIVNSCTGRLQDYEKRRRELAEAERKVEELKRTL